MGEPSAGVSFLGVKLAPGVAGFVGALVSLQFLAQATLFQRVVALFTGAVTAAYIAPAVNVWLDLGGQPIENGMAFLLGSLAMNLMAGLVEMAKEWQRDPQRLVDRIANLFRR